MFHYRESSEFGKVPFVFPSWENQNFGISLVFPKQNVAFFKFPFVFPKMNSENNKSPFCFPKGKSELLEWTLRVRQGKNILWKSPFVFPQGKSISFEKLLCVTIRKCCFLTIHLRVSRRKMFNVSKFRLRRFCLSVPLRKIFKFANFRLRRLPFMFP